MKSDRTTLKVLPILPGGMKNSERTQMTEVVMINAHQADVPIIKLTSDYHDYS